MTDKDRLDAKPCIAQAIWENCIAQGHDTKTAHGRVALDAALRRYLRDIPEENLRNHAVAIIRANRRKLFEAHEEPILRRLQIIEERLGIVNEREIYKL